MANTSFYNPGGSGDRSSGSVVTISTYGTISLTGSTASWFNGDYVSNTRSFNSATAGSSGFEFDFGSGNQKIINGTAIFQSNATACGTWRWYGSNDGSTWTALGNTFVWSGLFSGTSLSGRNQIEEPNGNTTAYRYYRLQLESGVVSGIPFQYGVDFRIADGSGVDGAFAIETMMGVAGSGGSSIVLPGLTTQYTDEIIVVALYNEKTGSPGNISSISSANLPSGSWTKRVDYQYTDTDNSHQHNLELWWAYASNALSSEAITVALSGATDDYVCAVMAFYGADIVTPFDTHSGLPGEAGNNNTTASTPQVTGVSTSATDTIVLGFAGNSTGTMLGSETIGSGYQQIVRYPNNGGANWAHVILQARHFNSAQSGITVGLTGAIKDWAMIADAVRSGTPVERVSLRVSEARDTAALAVNVRPQLIARVSETPDAAAIDLTISPPPPRRIFFVC